MVTNVTIKNSGRLDVLLTAIRSSAIDWIELQQPIVELTSPLEAGEQLDIVFAIKTSGLTIGKTSTLLTFLVQVSYFGIFRHCCDNIGAIRYFLPLHVLVLSFLFRMTTTQIASSRKSSISGFL